MYEISNSEGGVKEKEFFVFKATNQKGEMGFIIEKDGKPHIVLGIHPDIKKHYVRFWANEYSKKMNKKFPNLRIEVMDNKTFMTICSEMENFQLTAAADLGKEVFFIGFVRDQVEYFIHYNEGHKEYFSYPQKEGACIWTLEQANPFVDEFAKENPEIQLIMTKIN